MSKENNKRGKYNEKYNLDALEKLHLIMEDKDYWMTSLQLAEVSGRDHDKVMRDIRRDIVDKVQELRTFLDTAKKGFTSMNIDDLYKSLESYKCRLTVWKDKQGRKRNMFLLNRESSLICMARYNFIVQTRINQLFLDLYDKEKEKIKNKIDLYDRVISGEGTLSMGSVAKSFDIKDKDGNSLGRNKLFELLRNNEVLQANTSDWNIPYQMYVKNGYFRILFKKVKNDRTIAVTRVTPKGVEFIHNLIKILGYSYDGSLNEMKTFVSNDDYLEEDLDIYK